MALTIKQQKFAQEYILDRNATRAAKSAGYSQKTAYAVGHKLLKHAEIKKFIQQNLDNQLNKIAEKFDITAEKIIQKIASVAFSETYVKNSDILKACELLGKHFALFTEKLQVTGVDDGPIKNEITRLTDEELDKRIADLEKKLARHE